MAFKGLFPDISRVCSWLVSPIVSQQVGFRVCSNCFCTLCNMGFEVIKNEQSCCSLSNPPGLHDQALLNQIFVPSSFVHPFSCTWTITPLGIFCFGNIFLLKMIIGSSFVPAAQQARRTVKCVFMSTGLDSHGLGSFDVHSSVGWHIKCERDLIHTSSLGQLKVVF